MSAPEKRTVPLGQFQILTLCLRFGDTGVALETCMKCDGSSPCENEECQECCPHDEHDHGICLDCGRDRNGDLAGKAEDAFEGDR